MDRKTFRQLVSAATGIKAPGARAEFFIEWQAGLYITKIKKGISVSFGSRTRDSIAEVGAVSFEPPYVIEKRNFCYNTDFMTDEFCFIEPAKAISKLFKVLGLPFRYSMLKSEVEQHMRTLFGEVVYGPDKPY